MQQEANNQRSEVRRQGDTETQRQGDMTLQCSPRGYPAPMVQCFNASMLHALWPRTTFACSWDTLNACGDGALYGLYTGIAAFIWSIDRTLLLLAYQLDHLRWWLGNQAFLVAYGAIRSVAEPLLQPIAMLAIIVGLLLFLLVPILGKISLINIRQVLIWLVVAPVLLAEAGIWMLDLERLRTDVGGAITAQVSIVSAQGIFGATGIDNDDPIGAPTPLYEPAGGVSACGSGNVTRPAFGGTASLSVDIRMDDLAAALLLANAQDIHCPGEQAPGSILPDGFYGPFAVAEGQIEAMSNTDRARYLLAIQRGITRLALGIIACLLAVGETLIQFLFTLSLVIIWLALPFVTLLILFSDTLRPLGLLVQRIGDVLITAWIVSAILALIGVLLLAAATTGSAPALIALSLGGLFILVRLLLVALTTLNATFGTVTSVAGSSAGVAVLGAGAALATLGQSGMRIASGAVQGTAQAGVAAAMAAHVTGNGRYALGTALGGIRPIAQVGSVAASMGLISAETGAGLYAGERATRNSLATYARQLQRDSKRMRDGKTVREKAHKRSSDRQPQQDAKPTLLERAEQTMDYFGNEQLTDDLLGVEDDLAGGIQKLRSSAVQDVQTLGSNMEQAIQIATPSAQMRDVTGRIISGVVNTIAEPASVIRQRDIAQRPATHQGIAMHMGDHPRLEWLPKAISPANATHVDIHTPDTPPVSSTTPPEATKPNVTVLTSDVGVISTITAVSTGTSRRSRRRVTLEPTADAKVMATQQEMHSNTPPTANGNGLFVEAEPGELANPASRFASLQTDNPAASLRRQRK